MIGTVRLTAKGSAVIAKAEGGTYKIGDKVLAYREDNDAAPSPATIKKLWTEILSTGKREFADILFDGDKVLQVQHMTMFFE